MARILVVDDEPAVVDLVKIILEKAGHSVDEAYNGKEALKALGVDPQDAAAPLPDLVVLDVMMPIVDGYTVAITMKNDARAGRVPLIVVTAKNDMRHLFEAIPSVAAFVAKPFDPGALRATVAKILGA